MPRTFQRIWGHATVFLQRPRALRWVDLLVFVALAGIIFGITRVAREWTGELRPAVEIDLSPWALPKCTLFSLSRGLVAYVFSLIFTLLYGYWAAKDRLAERVLTPLLDILQSVPVLGFLPGLVLALVAAFPTSNLGLELAAVAMIFTGQAWNMTFSFYQSLKSIPQDQLEAARHFRFTGWQRFRWVELPFSTMGLVWNSMMSMAGGWFFLMINEAFVLQDKDFRLPGIGSYMSVAVSQGNIPAMLWAILAMIVMIVALDQLLWRPILVVAQRYRVEETGQQELMASWFLDPLRQSKVLTVLTRLWPSGTACRDRPALPPKKGAVVASGVSAVAFVVLLGILGYGAWRLVFILREVSLSDWGQILSAALLTLGRVLAATAIGTLWTVPAGLAIGLSPRLSRFLQPLIQVAASFPAPMLFPLIILALKALGVTLDWGSILLMLLGTQWYILFNVVAGAMAIPADLKEAARSYRLTPGQRFRILYLPAIFSNLVTGWVTAAGGAWNASIVAEFVTFRGEVLTAHGIGASISASAAQGNFGVLAASVAVMSALVVLFNHLVWRRCYKMAAERFSLSK